VSKKVLNSAWRDLLNSAGSLVRDWWQVDRVRASPREGRLMRLQPPCIIRVGRQVVEVLRRSVSQTSAGSYVTYDCDNGEGPCRLRVTPVGTTHCPIVHWVECGQEHEISEDQVVVYG
jgi:hypothetical protein